MTKFIERHIFHTGIPVYVNVDAATGLGNKEGDYSLYSNREQTDFKAIFELMLNYIVKSYGQGFDSTSCI